MIEVVVEIASSTPYPDEIDLDGHFDERTCIRYIGKARRQFDGTWTCMANVGGALCLVEVLVKPAVIVDQDPGDENVARRSY